MVVFRTQLEDELEKYAVTDFLSNSFSRLNIPVHSSIDRFMRIDDKCFVVAKNERELIGAVIAYQFAVIPEILGGVSGNLYWARNPEKSELFDHYSQYAKQIRARAIVQYFRNGFTVGNENVHDTDWYIDIGAVKPGKSKREIGSSLLSRVLKLIPGKTTVYTSALKGFGAESILVEEGFSHILRFGPVHQNGLSSCFMGYKKE